MKIPIKIGKTISKNEIIVCPECHGAAMIFEWPEMTLLKDSFYKICPLCNGKRILMEKSTVTYEAVTDNWQLITDPSADGDN